jgi:hypothetical protein
VKRALAAALIAAVAATISSCGASKTSDAKALRRILQATAAQPRAFVYEEATASGVRVVRGRIEDDLRYKATIETDGRPVLEEVVADDALSDRLLDPSGDELLLRNAAAGTPPEVAAALASGQWVRDGFGAPSLLSTAREKHVIGEDPIYDALTVLRYVDSAMGQSVGVRRFNPDSLDYKPKEDPFPAPDRGSDVIRYDLPPPRLPRPSDLSAGGALRQSIPDAPNFRKLAVYVKGGRVVRVLEEIDVRPRLRDLDRDYALRIPPGTATERAAAATEQLNLVRKAQGGEPIRPRSLDVSFIDVGKRVRIEIPDAAVEGDLSRYVHRGTAASLANTTATTTVATPGVEG